MKRFCSCMCGLLLAASAGAAEWKAADGPLMTRWARDVSPRNVHAEYPRPQMVRGEWRTLNGLWDYAVRPRAAKRPAKFDGRILVPFPVESALSGVMRRVGAANRLWYRRTFACPAAWGDKRVLLHFGAVDWQAEVFVNGRQVCSHLGGYNGFMGDITDALKADGEQELVVSVWDPTDTWRQPRGKQRNQPKGIWYTPVTGIWQSVWLEPVAATAIRSLRIMPDVDGGKLLLDTWLRGDARGCTVEAVVSDAGKAVSRSARVANELLAVPIAKPKLWSPASPFLYGLRVRLLRRGKVLDRVDSYFGMRKIALGKDRNGITRILLNGKPLFQYGPLDQGWWPDGLYTAPTDAALRYDLEVTRKLGFNMVRKHVKVEPDRWYYHCDRLGLLVWQDMPNGDEHARWPVDGTEIVRSANSAAQFGRELEAIVEARRNHPCIVVWVPFNEAWGQFETVQWTRRLKRLDPTRLVISASGGNDFGVGDVHDIHVYPGPEAPPAQRDRAAVLGEFGGLGLPIKGHLWQADRNWGYRKYKTPRELEEAYLALMTKLRGLIDSRLSAAVYTQTTDVEIEVNGLMTYDRAVVKMDADRLAAAHRKLYEPVGKLGRAALAEAHTVAYWRFEDGVAGKLVRHNRKVRTAVAARDVSGHKNHLYAFSAANAPRTGKHATARVVPLTGAANNFCLDDTAAGGKATRDLFTDPGRSRTHMNAVNTFQFNQWTVEASFRVAELTRIHGIVGKDGKPTDAPSAPLQLTVRGDDNRIEIAAIDSTRAVRRVTGRTPVQLKRWYHVAAVADGKTLRLYVDSGDGKGYVPQGRSDFVGALINRPGTWTVGRGFHNGKLGRDARAMIDEVRISAAALPVERFLFAKGGRARPDKTGRGTSGTGMPSALNVRTHPLRLRWVAWPAPQWRPCYVHRNGSLLRSCWGPSGFHGRPAILTSVSICGAGHATRRSAKGETP